MVDYWLDDLIEILVYVLVCICGCCVCEYLYCLQQCWGVCGLDVVIFVDGYWE